MTGASLPSELRRPLDVSEIRVPRDIPDNILSMDERERWDILTGTKDSGIFTRHSFSKGPNFSLEALEGCGFTTSEWHKDVVSIPIPNTFRFLYWLCIDMDDSTPFGIGSLSRGLAEYSYNDLLSRLGPWDEGRDGTYPNLWIRSKIEELTDRGILELSSKKIRRKSIFEVDCCEEFVKSETKSLKINILTGVSSCPFCGANIGEMREEEI